ncbi:MAG TPA: methyltransferase domain-containing protein [Methanocella sp.]|nr:methyltransferase domain-containing protein [Methanocella sp.]
MSGYWDGRYKAEGKIWGREPSSTVAYALDAFRRDGVKTLLVPGAGYGRNAVVFARSGMEVTGVEISSEALQLAEIDARIRYIQDSFIDVPVPRESFDAIYCYNVLHLFRKADRQVFISKCRNLLKRGGTIFFVVMSEMDAGFGMGAVVEESTFESKPGKPVHYFTDQDLREHFQDFDILETGVAGDHEDHGEEGPHIHKVRYVLAKKRRTYEFDGEKYRAASPHQREWGDRLIDSLCLKGNERILDLGCGDGTTTAKLADLVPEGHVLGIDASEGMIAAAKPLERTNLEFRRLDIGDLDFDGQFDVVFSNATLHWVKNHRRMLAAVYKSLQPRGRIRFNFAGEGNAENMIAAINRVIALPEYVGLFRGFEWPWYMPGIKVYRALVEETGFRDVRVELQNADRTFTEDSLVKFIDQPSIVPFLAFIGDNAAVKAAFRDDVINETKAIARTAQDEYFETFRRVDVTAIK